MIVIRYFSSGVISNVSTKQNNIKEATFSTGARPTQEQFADLIDSSLNLAHNGIFDEGGNLGLGHSSPSSRLSVKGSVTVSPNNDSAPGNGLFVHGNVGIGAGFTNPAAQLAVKGGVYIGNTETTDPGTNSLKVDGNIDTGGNLSTQGNLSITGTLHAMGDTTVNGTLTLADAQHVATDEVRARDNDGLRLYDAGGAGGLIIHDSGNVSIGRLGTDTHKLHITGTLRATGDTNIDGNLTLAHNQYVATDEVRARDSSGLKLHQAGGTGLLVHDSSGDVTADGNLTVSGSITAMSLSLTGNVNKTAFEGDYSGESPREYAIEIPENKVAVGLVVKRYVDANAQNGVFYTFALIYK